MNEERISIIVPIFNIEQYVGFCIESLIKQNYYNLEIILVDDGSTDRSPAICDLYAGKDRRIRVIHKTNGGLVSARKAGVELATGKYIGYVDGDDWVEPDFYEVLHRAAVKSKADIVCAGFSRDFFSQHVKCVNSVLDGIYEGAGLETLHERMLTYDEQFTIGVTTYVWNKLFLADIARAAQKDVDERITIGEDAAVTYPAFLKASRVYVCDNSSYHYRQREGSMLKIQSGFNLEIIKIKYMYQYLRAVFEKDVRHEMLVKQLDDFTLGYFIMRSGGVIQPGDISAFGTNFEGKKVVIVLAGTFGQVMYNRFRKLGYCDIAGWYDQDYWEYRRCCMNVDPLSEIVKAEFDYALSAKTNQEDIDRTKDELIKYGLDENKILTIDCEALERKKLLKKYLSVEE